MKKLQVGGVVGSEAFSGEASTICLQKSSSIAFNNENPTFLLQMNLEAFDLVVRQNIKYRQEQRIVFFHEHLPQMQAVYSRFFLLNRRELFRE